jgi:hypothetical protein
MKFFRNGSCLQDGNGESSDREGMLVKIFAARWICLDNSCAFTANLIIIKFHLCNCLELNKQSQKQ